MENDVFVFIMPIAVLIVGCWYIYKQSKGKKNE